MGFRERLVELKKNPYVEKGKLLDKKIMESRRFRDSKKEEENRWRQGLKKNMLKKFKLTEEKKKLFRQNKIKKMVRTLGDKDQLYMEKMTQIMERKVNLSLNAKRHDMNGLLDHLNTKNMNYMRFINLRDQALGEIRQMSKTCDQDIRRVKIDLERQIKPKVDFSLINFR